MTPSSQAIGDQSESRFLLNQYRLLILSCEGPASKEDGCCETQIEKRAPSTGWLMAVFVNRITEPLEGVSGAFDDANV